MEPDILPADIERLADTLQGAAILLHLAVTELWESILFEVKPIFDPILDWLEKKLGKIR